MNPQPLSDQHNSTSGELGEGVGRRLRAARLDRGLDLGHIAAQLHLKSTLVEALEAGRYAELPGPVFITGYIRNYARQVGLDPEPLIDAYHSAAGQTEPVRIRTQGGAAREDRVGAGPLVRLMTVAVVVGLAYLFAQWWQNRDPSISELTGGPGPGLAVEAGGADLDMADAAPERSAARLEELPTAGDATSAPVAGTLARDKGAAARPTPYVDTANLTADTPTAAPSRPPAAERPAERPAEPPVEPRAEPAVGAVEAPGAPETTAPDSLGQGEVVLEFRGPSWIDVRDSAKSFSLMGEMAKGDRRVLGGTPPYSLILGNASSVTVTVNGAPFDLTRVAKGNVARFKLNPADVNQVRQDAGATPPLSGRERGPGEARDLP